ncbi:Deoxyribose-phosphate aldolase [Planktothrix tepida]|uniref:Deoxyribose-phosphate aldolase n=1 Tax=Planktothrix tepida PCC 9214 TaxID=671072 RepID=A0A1J1LTR0_9CYAN|nr:deoxyribose-phosphate aldolase [Planktothrix tepida]CAD5977415.1 Deoxyribose-phosphate aldolase [Planktothrix tepida]CUR35984.1 Deoxyribose-phosphate aldolase [Planktothrix tepida PCC 9214]
MVKCSNMEIDIAPYIDHTLLNQTATPEEIQQCCYQAERYKFASVCVFPSYVKLAKELLQGKPPKVSTVIGFPTGATTSKVKLYEAQEAVENGATELDIVINLSWLKIGKTEELYQEIAEICEETGQTVKAIIETTILTEDEKRLAVEVLMDAGIAYIKTSTGWYGGATVADIQLIKSIAKGRVGIKASGGIRTYQQAVDLIIAGATRLGTSRGVEILTTNIQEEDSY